MKSPFALLTSLATLLALSACGQTGPLYLPKPPARPAAAQPAATPAGTTNTTTTTNGTTPTPPVQLSPPAPAAGVTVPVGNSNANNTEATNQSPPATQQ